MRIVNNVGINAWPLHFSLGFITPFNGFLTQTPNCRVQQFSCKILTKKNIFLKKQELMTNSKWKNLQKQTFALLLTSWEPFHGFWASIKFKLMLTILAGVFFNQITREKISMK